MRFLASDDHTRYFVVAKLLRGLRTFSISYDFFVFSKKT